MGCYMKRKMNFSKACYVAACVFLHCALTIFPEKSFADTVYVTDPGNAHVYAIDSTTNSVTAEISNGFTPFVTPQGVAFSPDRTIAYVTDVGSHTVYVVDVVTHTVTREISNNLTAFNEPQAVAFSPNGLIAYITDVSVSAVYVVDVTTHTTLQLVSNTFAAFVQPTESPFLRMAL